MPSKCEYHWQDALIMLNTIMNTDTPSSHSTDSSAMHAVDAGELATMDFFAGFSPHHLAQIARYSKRTRFAAEDMLFEQGELANRFYVIKTGHVAIELNVGGRRVLLQEIGPGEPVGFSWFFNTDTMHFTARALEPLEAVFFYGTLLREECELDRDLGYEMLRRTSQTMLERLEAMNKLLVHTLADALKKSA